MPQTKAEKNRVQRDNRSAYLHQQYQNRKQQTIHTFDKAQKEHWTHDALVVFRAQWLMDKSYHALPGWVKTKLMGVYDACWELLWRTLHVCYNHPDTGKLTKLDDLKDKIDLSKLDTKTCKMCFCVDGYLYPFT